MLQKVIEYTDFNGNERSETFCFHLSKAELAEMELMTDGGMVAKLEKIVETQNQAKIMEIFKSILLDSYGEKSEDGRHFIKSPERTKAFSETEAYSKLFMELITDADSAANFVNGILPLSLKE